MLVFHLFNILPWFCFGFVLPLKHIGHCIRTNKQIGQVELGSPKSQGLHSVQPPNMSYAT